MNWFYKYMAVVFLMLMITTANAQDKLTEHTFKLTETAEAGKGSLADIT